MFCKLTPTNCEAQRSFNDVAVRIRDKGELPHAASFMCIKPYLQDPSHGDDKMRTEDTETDTGTEAETETESENRGLITQSEQLRFKGDYILSLNNSPSFPLLGWFIGIGRWDVKYTKTNGGVDLQLALPRTKYEVAGRHARIFFDKNATLVIRDVSDRSPLIVLGNDEFTHGQRIITEGRTRISFGKLAYFFEFVISDEAEYQRNLRNFFANHLGLQPPAPDLSTTPSPWDSKHGDWLVKGTVGKGSFATVSAAKHTVTGEAGAAKVIIRTQESYPAIAREIELLKILPAHPQILQFRHVDYERKDRWFTGPADKEDERYSFKARPERVAIIYAPFARATVAELLSRMSMKLRLAAFQQLLQGIHALHSAGFIHRDIKPTNWGVVEFSLTEISTVILDYGQTIRAVTCKPKPGSIGTIPYLAPEMEERTYGPNIDMWACGTVGLQLFVTKGRLTWGNVVKERTKYDSILASLCREPAGTIHNLLSQLLAWGPEERVSAESAPKHVFFMSQPSTGQQSVNVQPGQKRHRSQSTSN